MFKKILFESVSNLGKLMISSHKMCKHFLCQNKLGFYFESSTQNSVFIANNFE